MFWLCCGAKPSAFSQQRVMNIVYVSSAALPSREANSIHVMQMAYAFSSHGHDVTLLAPARTSSELAGENLWSFYGMESRFRLQRLLWFRSVLGWLCYGAASAYRARMLNADLVYSRNIYGSWWSACVLGLPTVWELHEIPGRRSRLARRMAAQLSRCPNVRLFVAITGCLKDDLVGMGFDANRIVVAHDGAPAELAQAVPSTLTPIRDGNLQVGYVGHLYEGKGMETIAQVVPLCPWADFHIVGGSDRDVRLWRERLGGQKNVRFHGFVRPAAVKSLMYGLDVALVPLRRDIRTAGGGLDISRWTSPLKVLEYMATGRAILASDLPVLQELLTDRLTALIRPIESVSAWASALEDLRRRPSLRQRLGENARREFLCKYTWERRAENLLTHLHMNDLRSLA